MCRCPAVRSPCASPRRCSTIPRERASMPEIASVLSGLGRLSLRGGPQVLAAAGDAFELQLPVEACRAAEGDARAALWLGPDEQLLLVQLSDFTAAVDALTRRLAGIPHSLVD